MVDNKQIFTPVIKTERLVLRQWCEDDLEPFAKLNADPRVMEWFPSTLSRAGSDDLAKRISPKLQEQGWGLWAVSIPDISSFIGFIGLAGPTFNAHFTPAVEVGWRLAYEYWGKGYATEGALAALKYGYEMLNLKEIVSFTTLANQRSRHVMEKIGMHHDPKDDFDHPKLPKDHLLKKHVLYRMNHNEWRVL
ncbi:Acetyltransferase [Candidatus Protochlamydia amoebophila]|uniref:GNAT family N-acetyltransferase n=1 Tax=Candidatus Protochlamydia amoebophila TaxID=362787 RepID=UPI001BC99915|nr:GNAT family N-acetyltransferase [Candidatus Protochlamydia amoebophila]MBS4163765.1 Acetyltransferase [Candidatus Protochlamydia amoebophila]